MRRAVQAQAPDCRSGCRDDNNQLTGLCCAASRYQRHEAGNYGYVALVWRAARAQTDAICERRASCVVHQGGSGVSLAHSVPSHSARAQDIPCTSGGDCVVFVDRLEIYHIVAIIWFCVVLILGLLWRAGRGASPKFERVAAQLHPLWRLAPSTALSSFSDLCLADFILAAWTLAAYAVFVAFAANDRESYSDGGQAAGRLAAFMLSVTILPVTRNSLYLLAFRIPFERAIRWHRWNSRLLTVVFLAHGGRMMAQNGWRILGSTEPTSTGFGACYGVAAACCFLTMGILAIDPIRRHFWELFKMSHMARSGGRMRTHCYSDVY